MAKRPINQVLADNLAYYMTQTGITTQSALAGKAGLSQRTIGNYLKPQLRSESARGKAPSAKLTEIEKIADALKLHVWQLLRPASAAQRDIYRAMDTMLAELEKASVYSPIEADGHAATVVTVHEPKRKRAGG